MKLFLTFLLLSFSCSCLFSQADEYPTAVLSRDRKIAPSQHDYLQKHTNPQGDKITLLTLKSRIVQPISYKGRDCLVLVQRYQSPRGDDSDTTYLDPATLLPLEYHTQIRSERYEEHVFFREGTIDVTVVYKDSVIHHTYPYDGKRFMATADMEVLRLLPLKDGYSAKLTAVNAGKNQADIDIYVKVLGTEDIVIGNLKVRTYKVGLNYRTPPTDKFMITANVTIDTQEVIRQKSARLTQTRLL